MRYIGLRFSTNASDTAWQCGSGDGTTGSVTSTGVTVAVSTTYLVTLDWTISGTLTCSISANGGTPVVTTKSTNLDNAGTTNLGITNTLTTLANTAFNHKISFVHLERQ